MCQIMSVPAPNLKGLPYKYFYKSCHVLSRYFHFSETTRALWFEQVRPSNAEATFVQSTRRKIYLKTI